MTYNRSSPGSATLTEVVERYLHDGRLQTFEDRERFRKEARAAQTATPTIDTVPSCGSENDYRRATHTRGEAADNARDIVTEWLGMFDPPPQIDFQQSEMLQGAIASALAIGSETEKKASDAPVWYSAKAANGWASGYNAAIGARPTAGSEGTTHPVEKLWRQCDLPEWFLGNGGSNTKLYALYDRIRHAAQQSAGTAVPYAVEYRIERDGHLYSYMHAGEPPAGAQGVRWLYLDTAQPSVGGAEAIIEEAMWMLQDVPGDTLIERVARLTKWYQDLCSNGAAQGCGDPNCKDPDCTYGKGPQRCQNCGDPISEIYCGTCREMGCSISSTEGK